MTEPFCGPVAAKEMCPVGSINKAVAHSEGFSAQVSFPALLFYCGCHAGKVNHKSLNLHFLELI